MYRRFKSSLRCMYFGCTMAGVNSLHFDFKHNSFRRENFKVRVRRDRYSIKFQSIDYVFSRTMLCILVVVLVILKFFVPVLFIGRSYVYYMVFVSVIGHLKSR